MLFLFPRRLLLTNGGAACEYAVLNVRKIDVGSDLRVLQTGQFNHTMEDDVLSLSACSCVRVIVFSLCVTGQFSLC